MMPEKFSNLAFDIDKSREQLLKEIYELQESLAAKERRCLELSEENTRLARSPPEKEAFYQILYEHIPLAYQSLDAAGNLIAVNKAWLNNLGYTHEEVIGRNFADFLRPDYVKHFQENFHRFKSEGEILEVELEMVKKDGCLLLVSFDGKISRDNLGNFRQTHCIIQDITERKRTEEDLRRYRQIVSFTPDGVSLVDRDYRYRIVNDAYETFSGRKREQLLGRHVAEYLGEEAFHTQVQPSFDRCMQGETIRYRAWFDYPALGRRFVDVTYFPYQEFDGSITGVVASTRDITDVKQAEDALQRSEARYRLLHESMRDGFVQVMMDGRIIDCNDVYCRMLGYTAEELRFLTYIQITPESWHDIEANIVRDQILPRGYSDIYEKEYRRKDGTIFPVELRSILIRDGEGRPNSMWAIVRDITDRKKNEEELKTLNDELERRVEQRTYELQAMQQQYLHAEKLSAIGKLSASIAHEFNNPLQSVMTVLEGLKKTGGLEGVDLKMLDLAIGESERMKKLIGSLRDFNRPTSDRKSFIDMHQSIESILMLTKSDFRKKKTGVILDFSPHLPRIFVVPDQIKQVLLNLLTNAMDACTGSGGEIKISTSQEGDRVAVAVKDNGIGISAKNMEHIFRPFFTTKAEVKGTGLGLAVSYGIVKNHKGEFKVESEPGVGTTFTVLLPINSEESNCPSS